MVLRVRRDTCAVLLRRNQYLCLVSALERNLLQKEVMETFFVFSLVFHSASRTRRPPPPRPQACYWRFRNPLPDTASCKCLDVHRTNRKQPSFMSLALRALRGCSQPASHNTHLVWFEIKTQRNKLFSLKLNVSLFLCDETLKGKLYFQS